MSDETQAVEELNYDYNEASATRADDAASRLNDNGQYVGQFTRAEATRSSKSNAHGIILGFDSPGMGSTEFTLWTKSADGVEYFGKAQLDAIRFLLGMQNKPLKPEAATVKQWADNSKGEREEMEVPGHIFPDLLKKPIGVVLQKELYTTNKGSTGERLNLVGLFQPETKLMMSEIKERKTTPVKLDRLVRGLKTKDSRKLGAAEPAQPGMGLPDGGY